MDVARSRDGQDRGTDPGERNLRLALAQLPPRMRRAIRLFRGLTGFSAVASLRTAVEDPPGRDAIAPSMHPRCSSLLRRTESGAPCEEQWQRHLRAGPRSEPVQSHVCPLGLRCSCVPIFYGETLIGIAKLVVGPEATDRRFSLAVEALELTVSRVCQDFHVSALTEELEGLRRQVAELRKVRRSAQLEPHKDGPEAGTREGHAPMARTGSLVDQALRHLDGHYLDRGLSLAGLSRALGVNGQYLTRLFTRVVGQRMHAYIQDLRVYHACRLLLSTDKRIREIALESGFRRPERFSRAFRDHIGVAPTAYRRIFTAN